jgi:long-subunit acyl-CoA synthetase (AMP-forming)
MTPADVHLSYLPLAHVFERVVQSALWFGGSSIGFYQGNTLKIVEDLKVLRPTIFPSVPRYVLTAVAGDYPPPAAPPPRPLPPRLLSPQRTHCA